MYFGKNINYICIPATQHITFYYFTKSQGKEVIYYQRKLKPCKIEHGRAT